MRILEGFYSIDFDHERNVVRLSSYGFWTLEVVDQFARDVKYVRSIVGAHRDCLMDGSLCEVRTPEVADALARLAQKEDHVFLGRTAMVMSSTLLKMQNRRFLKDDRFEYFDNEEAALQWLATGGPAT